MWGTQKDFKLLEKLSRRRYEPIKQFIQEREGWNKGVGFETSKPNDRISEGIRNLPFLDASRVERFYTPFNHTSKIDIKNFRGFGNEVTYIAPHILIKEGQKDKRFCASFIDFDCSFRRTIYGISSIEDSAELKVLTAFLNSSFASYVIFLSASSWGVERERVQANEILSLPGVSFMFDLDTKERLVNKIDEIINIRKNEVFEISIRDEENEIDAIVLNAIKLNVNEKHTIEDTLSYSLDLFQNNEKSIALERCTLNESKSYAEILCGSLNDTLKYEDNLNTWCTVYDIPSSVPLNIVSLHFNADYESNGIRNTVIEKSSEKVNTLLRDINSYTYQKYAESVYFRKTVKYAVDNIVYLIKPNEKRFWSRSAAMNDADDVMLEFAYA